MEDHCCVGILVEMCWRAVLRFTSRTGRKCSKDPVFELTRSEGTIFALPREVTLFSMQGEVCYRVLLNANIKKSISRKWSSLPGNSAPT